MYSVKKKIVIVVLALGAMFLCVGSSSEPWAPSEVYAISQPIGPPTVPTDGSKTAFPPEEVPEDGKDNDVPKEYDPFVIVTAILAGLTTVLGAAAGFVHALRKFKETKIADSQQKADEATKQKNEAIARQREAEEERDDLADRLDKEQKNLLERKNFFHQELINKERQYRQEIQKLHEENRAEADNLYRTLVVEIRARKDRDIILAQHGIDPPAQPPPITQQMKDEVTVEDHIEAQQALDTGSHKQIDKQKD